ncbi:MAG: RNA-binding S4 domain-containing protein [Lachnospiraceae bacterium]|nr:RNA-binding S4 domain-containing protein [Lachnospiraceae bacterium]
MEKLVLRNEYITLGQLLKAVNLVEDGVEAKEAIRAGEASVNGEVDTRRGRKLYDGDKVNFRDTEILVVR